MPELKHEHRFCEPCLRGYLDYVTRGHIVNPAKITCPARKCGKELQFGQELMEKLCDRQFDKYITTHAVVWNKANPFHETVKVVQVAESVQKKLGKCFVEECKVTKGYVSKVGCKSTCSFFWCKDHSGAAYDKIAENEKVCPGCQRKYKATELAALQADPEVVEADMKYDPPEQD